MKTPVLKLLLLTGVGLASFILLEAGLLLFNDSVFRDSFYVFDPDLGFKVRPYANFGAGQANEFGFNDRDYPHERSSGSYRILFLGDSFNWMGGREKNYVSLVDKLFEKEFGVGRVEIINAGYSQTHTAEQLKALRKFGLQYHPDLVILSVFAGNDFYDADPRRTRIAVGGGMTDIIAGRDGYTVSFGQPVVFQSRLFLFLEEKWRTYQRRRQEQASTVGPTGRQEKEAVGAPDRLQRRPEQRPDLSPDYLHSLHLRTQFNDPARFEDFKANVDLICDSVVRMQELLSGENSQLHVAIFPDEIQVDEWVRQRFLEHYQFESNRFEWNRAQRILRDLCRRHSILFYDLLPLFAKETSRDRSFYLPNNGHWNDAGNELAADYFFSVLAGPLSQRLGP